MEGKKWQQRENDYDQNPRKCVEPVQRTPLQWDNRDCLCMWVFKMLSAYSIQSGCQLMNLITVFLFILELSIMYRVSGIFLILNHFFLFTPSSLSIIQRERDRSICYIDSILMIVIWILLVNCRSIVHLLVLFIGFVSFSPICTLLTDTKIRLATIQN